MMRDLAMAPILSGLMIRLRETAANVLFGDVPVADERRSVVDAARRNMFRKLAPLGAAHSVLSAIILLFALWGDPSMPLVLCWCYASAVLMIVRIIENRSESENASPAIEDARIFRRTLASGLVWAVLLGGLLASASPEQGMALGVLGASTLCMGALIHWTFARAALAYSLGVGFGIAAGMLLGGHALARETIALLTACVVVLQLFAAASKANFIQRVAGTADLADAKETVSVLLADFETHSADWLWRTDAAGRLGTVSQRFADAAGLTTDSMTGARMAALFTPEDAARIEAILRERRAFSEEALQIAVGDRKGWWSLSGQPTADGGYRGVASDITRSRDAEARIAFVTEFDPLTELPNRAMLVNRLEAAFETARSGDQTFALLCIDLDNFKAINDRLGHPVGDGFLRLMSARLKDSAGADAFVARLGGDEFAVLLPNGDEDAAADRAEELVDAMLAPVNMGAREILAGGSIGVAIAVRDGEDPAALLKNAELALYRAKAQGRGCVRFFEAGMDVDARWRADLEADLRNAVNTDAMSVYFQPLVDTRTRCISGYETLLRWNRPGHGLVSPGVFIACAEETGIIVPLGEWVIRRAIAEAANWRDPVKVAINLSPAQMRNPSLVATVRTAIAANAIDPARVEIEITESVLMHETEQNLRTLHELKQLGVKIALDDFGTGYSSLSYLRAFPFDKIKIDQRFVRDIDTSVENQAIVRAVISLARDLGMRVTAEGVEDERQAAMLAGLGCHEVQGYLYSRPIPAGEVPQAPRREPARILSLPPRQLASHR